MAISMLQEAQTRNLAAALAGMQSHSKDEIMGLDQHHHHHHSLSMSPPMSASSTPTNSNMYPGLQQAAASAAFGMLSPSQLLAANRQAAAAFMAAQLPMSTLASTLFPHHPALFSSWAAAAASHSAPHLHSPPSSPHSPITVNTPTSTQSQHMSAFKHGLSTSPTARLEQQSSEAGPAKKARKISVKKDLVSPPPMEICSMSVSDLYNTPTGPISPPSSGSSPNSSAHETSGGQSSGNQGGKDPSRDKSFTCKICQRSFGYKHVLQNHERTHTGEKPFECPECHKRFTRDHHLKTHMRLHTGEKPYHCSHCDRQFVQVANLRRHLRVHTGEKPYNCEICDGKFSDSNQLKSHMLVHNGEKPFECERCHQKFRRRHHLLNHKCGLQSPPTPALSPATSGDYPTLFNNDHKSIMGSSYGSDELNPYMTSSYESSVHEPMHEDGPLDLSEDGTSSVEDPQGRLRKSNDIRRVFRLPHQISHVATDMPEQTEPEDLSVRSPRSASNSASTHDNSDHMQHEDDDIDLDELDDAATLFMRQQHAAALKRDISHIPME